MISAIAQPVELAVDVSAALPFAGESNALSATVHVRERPHDDVAFCRASQDVTLLVLSASAHCRNFAAPRAALWDRAGTWAAAVADHLGGGAAAVR